MKKKKASQPNNTPAFFRQQSVLQRMSSGLLGRAPADDEETRERIMFITHLKPLQPKTAITDDLVW
jgi:hypothetical protein